MKYIISCSFGKDSLAMLLKMLEKKEKIDEVIFYDTGMEFQVIYNIRDKVVPILQNQNIKYTELKPRYSFEYNMFEKKVNHRNGTFGKGYSWCGGRCRWGTSEKNFVIFSYLKNTYGDGYKECVGIAYDEPDRLKNDSHKVYPLFYYKMTERDCLEYCYEKGFFGKKMESNYTIFLTEFLVGVVLIKI